ncbi:MAG: phospho-sugar mutase [Oscillospiraceae bacterium]|nr:phospho-sugar mutase [Oscillospiraceae bacterium]
MNSEALYKKWLTKAQDPRIHEELAAIEGNKEEILSRFGAELTFGTAGLRGILGAGENRMNVYTVRRATQGLADSVNERYGGGCVAISYDSRNMSREFARESAGVLAANGITAYIYDRLMPTPMLSFAVRELKAKAGIMITASHNPAIYNGYKAYGADGCQMTTEDASAVYDRICRVDIFDGVKTKDFNEGIADGSIKYISKFVIEQYYNEVLKCKTSKTVCEAYPIRIVYSPLNGTGNEPVRRIFEELGLSDVFVVEQQEKPDGDFPTCPYPNPETKEALALGLALCEEKKPDLFIATDPDADRVGVAFRERDGGYRILSGNEVGVLLLNYIIEARTANCTMPRDPVAVKSIVSTGLADEIAKRGGVEMITVLTGFKYIGEQILFLEQKGEADRFIFGFEESCGYLAGSYVRDKDAVLAAMLLCEMTSYYKARNKTPLDVLSELYETYGYYVHKVVNAEFAGIDGAAQMQSVMGRLYAHYPEAIAGWRVTSAANYKTRVRRSLTLGTESPIALPSADVVEFLLENGATVMVRPSGTEPKMKLYLSAREKSLEESRAVIDKLAVGAKELIRL